MSQRSGRYVDDLRSPIVRHPCKDAFLADTDPVYETIQEGLMIQEARTHREARISYESWRDIITTWLWNKGFTGRDAAKLARAAARGDLPTSTWTNMVFSASVDQWRWMLLALRGTRYADPPIRELACKILGILQESRYKEHFRDMVLLPSPDGIGTIIEVEKPEDPDED